MAPTQSDTYPYEQDTSFPSRLYTGLMLHYLLVVLVQGIALSFLFRSSSERNPMSKEAPGILA